MTPRVEQGTTEILLFQGYSTYQAIKDNHCQTFKHSKYIDRECEEQGTKIVSWNGCQLPNSLPKKGSTLLSLYRNIGSREQLHNIW